MKVLGFSDDSNYEALTPEEVLAALGLQSSIAELNYTDGVTSNIQTQLNGKFNNPSGTIAQYIRGDGTLFNFPGVGNGIILSANNIHLGAPSSVTLASTNSTTSTSHTHAFSPGGTTSQYIRGDGSLATFPTVGSGTVTSVAAGNGLNFTTITGSGSVTLGTPSTLSGSTTNSVTSTSHTHALSANLSSWDATTLESTGLYGATNPVSGDPDTHFGTSAARFARIVNTGSNLPFSWGTLIHTPYDTGNGCQLAMSYTSDQIKWRRSSAMGTWHDIYHTGYPSPIKINNAGMTGTDVSGQGLWLGWNYPSGQGNGVFVNNRGSGAGGFRWYDTTSGDLSAASQIMDLSSGGNLTVNRVDVGMNYTSIGNAVALSPGTAGTISLRPQGLGQTANQTTISSDGSMSVGGDVSSAGSLYSSSYGKIRGVSSAFVLSFNGTTTGPTIYFRPRGDTSVVSQTTIDWNGNMSVSGTVADVDGDVRRMKGRVANGSTTLADSDLNGVVEKNNNGTYTYTLAASLGTVRDAITIVNSGPMGSITLARASGVTLYRNGVNANITIGPGSMVTIYRSNTLNRWIA